jgi:hypothetical protein
MATTTENVAIVERQQNNGQAAAGPYLPPDQPSSLALFQKKQLGSFLQASGKKHNHQSFFLIQALLFISVIDIRVSGEESRVILD